MESVAGSGLTRAGTGVRIVGILLFEVIMDCPVCREAMITLELDEVEIDHCLACGGIWLDAGELETLLGDSEKASAVVASFVAAAGCTERSRKCPICLKKMEKVWVGPEERRVLIDRCRKADGLWFDKGELEDIFAGADFDEEHKVEALLKEMFGGGGMSNERNVE